MRRAFRAVILTCICMMLATAGCTDKKPAVTDSLEVDSLADTLATDSVEEMFAEQPVPKAADELFDDFFFTFIKSKKHQLERIDFPLQVTQGKKTTLMQRREWRMDRFFMDQNYYTLIFDNRRQMSLPKDTSINNVVVEKIDLTSNSVRKYHFDRRNGEWRMTQLEKYAQYQQTNASFLHFYQKFATDTLYQMEHLSEEIAYMGPDPENENEDMKGVISPDEWFYMGPGELPSGILYNILYGQEYVQSGQKILLLRGISNGQEMEMEFKRKDGEWMLTGIHL